MININGVIYRGNNISINNGNITIDGVNVLTDNKIINISVGGDISVLSIDSCESINVHGNVADLKTISGDVHCQNILGSVQTVSGDVHANIISGNVNTISGDIN